MKEQARTNHRSLEAEARQLLTRHAPAKVDVTALVADLREHQARMTAKYGVFSDSTELIRKMRDEE